MCIIQYIQHSLSSEKSEFSRILLAEAFRGTLRDKLQPEQWRVRSPILRSERDCAIRELARSASAAMFMIWRRTKVPSLPIYRIWQMRGPLAVVQSIFDASIHWHLPLTRVCHVHSMLPPAVLARMLAIRNIDLSNLVKAFAIATRKRQWKRWVR